MTNIKKTPLAKIILLSGTGFFMFVCMDSLAKYLGGVMPITQAVWGRFFFHFITLVIYFFIFKPKINLKKMSKVIGKDTKSAVRSGFFWGYAGLIDNIINLIKKEIKKPFTVSITGGFSKLFKNSIKTKVKQDFDITINGLIKASKLIK